MSVAEGMKPRRLATIAAWINAHLPALLARVERDHCNTDRKWRDVRWRWPGKGRDGTRILVTERGTGRVVLDHSSAETYRSNREVEEWLERWRRKNARHAPKRWVTEQGWRHFKVQWLTGRNTGSSAGRYTDLAGAVRFARQWKIAAEHLPWQVAQVVYPEERKPK